MELSLQYIYSVQNNWWNATHERSKVDANAREEATAKYEALKSIIFGLLATELDRNESGHLTLFGRPISDAALSHGQIALLRWSVALHAHGTDPGEAIVTIDEPENHLHPDGMINAISRLIDVNKDGQIWIATHSVPLLAALFSRYPDDVSLYYMHQGAVKYAGREPERILLSLMGGEDNIGALRQFTGLPELLAVNRFGAECLVPPTVVAHAMRDDPQVEVTHSAVVEASDLPIKILDYGARHARILEGLRALHGEHTAEQIDYVAWDICNEPSRQCVASIGAIYGSIESRWYNDPNALFERSFRTSAQHFLRFSPPGVADLIADSR